MPLCCGDTKRFFMSIDAWKSEVEMFHICLLFGLLVTFWILWEIYKTSSWTMRIIYKLEEMWKYFWLLKANSYFQELRIYIQSWSAQCQQCNQPVGYFVVIAGYCFISVPSPACCICFPVVELIFCKIYNFPLAVVNAWRQGRHG